MRAAGVGYTRAMPRPGKTWVVRGESVGILRFWRGFVRRDTVSKPVLGSLLASCVVCLALASPLLNLAHASGARKLPPQFRDYPYSVMSLTVGHPNAGYQVRAKKLRDTPHLAVKASSTDYRYAHPALVLMLRRSSREIARSVPGSVMVVGDLSREDGGPLRGHRSHQSGRDADVGFYARDRDGNSVKLERFVKFGRDGKATDGSGLVFDDYRNWLLVQSWVLDARAGLSHIFVSRGLRARLLTYAASRKDFARHVERAAVLLKQPERGEPHDDHFHVRIACPERQIGLCKNESLKR